MARRHGVLSEDPEAARSQILRAAETAIQRFGIAKTTIDDVAKETGVSRPTIYRYFRDRDTLMTSMIEARSRRLFEQAREYVSDRDTFAEQVVEIVEGPFSDFSGTVEEVIPDKGKVRVSVSLFGRPTSVELDFLQLKAH